MQEWNAVISVRERGFRQAFDVFGEFGEVKRTEFFNILLLRARDIAQMLETLRLRAERSPESLAFLARLIPVTRTFIFNSPEEFEDRARTTILGWVPDLAGKSFFVRIHRRGFMGQASEYRLHLRDAYALLARVTGVPAPTRRIPFPLLGVVAAGNEAWARLSGRPVLIGLATYRNLRATGPYNLYDSTKAERELGVTFRPLETTFRDAALWMRAQGLLPEARSPESTRRSTARASAARPSAAP